MCFSQNSFSRNIFQTRRNSNIMMDTAGVWGFVIKEIIPEGRTSNSQYFSRTSIFKIRCYSTQMSAVAPSGTWENKATLCGLKATGVQNFLSQNPKNFFSFLNHFKIIFFTILKVKKVLIFFLYVLYGRTFPCVCEFHDFFVIFFATKIYVCLISTPDK